MNINRAIFSISAAALLLAASGAAMAQPGPGGNAFQFRLGGFLPEGGGDLWDGVEQAFTLDSSDFDDGIVGFSYITSLNNHFEIGVNADFYDSTVFAAYRPEIVVDEDGFLIFHDTHLSTVPLTVDVRFLPTGRYRGRGQRQVRHPVVFIGAGAGVNLWEYEEVGDFVDFDDPALPIFFDEFTDSGAALTTYVLGGIEFPVSPRFNLTFEGRYSWSDDELGDEFAGLGEIELGGTSFFVGGAFRF